MHHKVKRAIVDLLKICKPHQQPQISENDIEDGKIYELRIVFKCNLANAHIIHAYLGSPKGDKKDA